MQIRSKYFALFLLASAAVMGCAGEPADESISSPEETLAVSDTAAKQSSEVSQDEAAGDTEKGLRDDYCCVLKRWVCDFDSSSPDCRNGNKEAAWDCIDTKRTKIAAKSYCAVKAAGDFISGHALRDKTCSNYGDCLNAWARLGVIR